ncbi:hypothetical protein DDE18_08470 [Nocardioides gansuensis]|uniref:CHAT domain-containing protein n=1 Tax=Nocardioides gansuensis TaxID=2138300 RepID=A0A2T8FC83_9ACTN|nr:CHAT domain-containing protein [Nocardioides gansuensis]PVG83319.1 hypothetical protein DDE18_08470 [Nocardioides gansuensis]
MHLHGRDRAVATLAEARREAAACGSAYATALAGVQEGTVWMSLGDWPRGLAALRAVQHLDLRLPLERLAVLLNRGLAEVTLLDLDAGRRDLLAALQLSEEQGWPEMVFKARHNLGCLEYFAGNLPAAIRLMREADDMDVEVDRVRARHDLGRVLLEAGLVAPAVRLLEEAARTARDRHQRLDEAEVLLDLARAHLLAGRLEQASGSAGAAARAFAARSDRSRAEQARLVRQAVDLSRGVRTRVLPVGDEAARDSVGRMALRLLAEGRLARGDLAAAESALAELPRRGRDGLASEMHERFLRAWLADARGDSLARSRHLRAAAGRLEQQRGRTQSLEVRAGVSVHGRRLAELDLARALRSGRPHELFASVERWRGAAQRVPPVTPDDDPEVAALVSELRLVRHGADSGQSGDSGLGIADRVAGLEQRLERLTWARRGGTVRSDRLASYAEVRARLAERGETLVVYVAHAGRYHCLLMGGRTSVMRELPAGDVDALAERLRRDLRAQALAGNSPLAPMLRRAVAASARELDAVVGAPLADLLEGPVVVAPTRQLVSVPWPMLPTLAGLPITVVPSISRWGRWSASPTSPGAAVTVLAGPGIPQAGAEIELVAAAWREVGTAVRCDVPASSAEVVAAFGRPGVVHVAAHGAHEEQSPLFSSLRMADGPVFAHEIADVRAAHAVLSACDVGQSHVRPGDEPLGLTAALLALGVSSVVAAVAPLPDAAAAEAMVRYHRGLAAGQGAAATLAQVRSAVPEAAVLSVYGADWSRG